MIITTFLKLSSHNIITTTNYHYLTTTPESVLKKEPEYLNFFDEPIFDMFITTFLKNITKMNDND
jgi:hypothetical protein